LDDVTRAFQELSNGLQSLVNCQSDAAEAGYDTRERIQNAFDLARDACDQLRPLVDDDELGDMHDAEK
jgi:hypothetical protein